MAQRVTPVYFTDENTLGLGKLLRRCGRTDVVYPGHEELPEVPRGTDDQHWLTVAGAQGFIVLSRDRRIRSRPAELRAYLEHGVRSVWISWSAMPHTKLPSLLKTGHPPFIHGLSGTLATGHRLLVAKTTARFPAPLVGPAR